MSPANVMSLPMPEPDPLESEYPAGRKLAEILLGPVRPLLASGVRVVLVPDRALFSLNFETLPDPENPSKYLIERLTLELAPSLDVLVENRVPAKLSDALLLIGNPDQAVEEYPRLPFAGNEIGLISKTFPSSEQTVLEGARAYLILTTLNRLVKVLDVGSKANGAINFARQTLERIIERLLNDWLPHWPNRPW